jgi:hypothetical protein
MASKRWLDWINLILGLWTVASPWILGFVPAENSVLWSTWILGAAIVVFAGLAVYIPKAWEEALNIILGVALCASPWVLGFTNLATPTKNAVIVGLLVIAFGVWAMLGDTTLQKWWHEHYGPR